MRSQTCPRLPVLNHGRLGMARTLIHQIWPGDCRARHWVVLRTPRSNSLRMLLRNHHRRSNLSTHHSSSSNPRFPHDIKLLRDRMINNRLRYTGFRQRLQVWRERARRILSSVSMSTLVTPCSKKQLLARSFLQLTDLMD